MKRRISGASPQTPGFIAFRPGWIWTEGASRARSPPIPAPGSALGSHPCVALSSAPASVEFSSTSREETK